MSIHDIFFLIKMVHLIDGIFNIRYATNTVVREANIEQEIGLTLLYANPLSSKIFD